MDTEKTTLSGGKKKFLILIAIIAIFGIAMFIVNQKKREVPMKPISPDIQAPQDSQKTDFGTKVPAEFPADIPIEKEARIEQSYSLNYVDQKQISIAFMSSKTVKENYDLYVDFLKNKKWNISNKYESEKVSSLYGTKESNDINVTISENTSSVEVKSQVSISVLKK